VTLGHYYDDQARLVEAERIWQGAAVSISTTRSLLKARWEKLCWNIPFNGMTIAAGGVPTDRLLADPELRETTLALMEEVVKAGNADLAHRGWRRSTARIIERMFPLTATMGAYRPSTLVDFLDGRPLEVAAIFGEALRRARSLQRGDAALGDADGVARRWTPGVMSVPRPESRSIGAYRVCRALDWAM
jgi:2-dehydropantoate 2-reductase